MTDVNQPGPSDRTRFGRVVMVFMFVALALLVVVLRQRHVSADRPGVAAPPRVPVSVAVEPNGNRTLILPASVEARTETAIFARAPGYLKSRLVDMGDSVKAGQLMAEVESPDLDREVQQAEADLQEVQSRVTYAEALVEQAKAKVDLAEASARRSNQLVAEGVLSRQAGDEQHFALLSLKAELAAAAANVQRGKNETKSVKARLARLQELKTYQSVRAPFDGVVISRKADVGTLLIPGNAAAPQELFRLIANQQPRVLVRIPQEEAPLIYPDQECVLVIGESEQNLLPGRVSRTSRSFDPESRTLLIEVAPKTAAAALAPGLYLQVRFVLPVRPDAGIRVPASAVAVRNGVATVALVDPSNHVRFQPVVLGRDEGTHLEVLSGLRAGERFVTALSDAVQANEVISPVSDRAH